MCVVNTYAVARTGMGIEHALSSVASCCNLFLKQQLRILRKNLQNLAFGRPIIGVNEHQTEQALSYLTMRVDEIDANIESITDTLSQPHFSSEHINIINRIYPHIYRDCLQQGTLALQNDEIYESEEATIFRSVRETMEDDESVREDDEIPELQADTGMMNGVGMLMDYFNRIDNLNNDAPPQHELRPNFGRAGNEEQIMLIALPMKSKCLQGLSNEEEIIY